MTAKEKAAIEEAANRMIRDGETLTTAARFYLKMGMQEVIEHPERYGQTARKNLGIHETRALVNIMLAEEISFSRFVELINEGGK